MFIPSIRNLWANIYIINSGMVEITIAAIIALSGVAAVPEVESTDMIICFNIRGRVYFFSSVIKVAGSIIEFHLATYSMKNTVANPGRDMGI